MLNEVGIPNFGRAPRCPSIRFRATSGTTIATEDPNFYQHPGVYPVGCARGLSAIRDRDLSGPGGSTITQQLVKLLPIVRKNADAEDQGGDPGRRNHAPLSRGQATLQLYVNEIYYGNLAYGIQAAAETYFDRNIAEPDIGPGGHARLAAPGACLPDPYTKLWNADGTPGAVKRRQGEVLRLMVAHGW